MVSPGVGFSVKAQFCIYASGNSLNGFRAEIDHRRSLAVDTTLWYIVDLYVGGQT